MFDRILEIMTGNSRTGRVQWLACGSVGVPMETVSALNTLRNAHRLRVDRAAQSLNEASQIHDRVAQILGVDDCQLGGDCAACAILESDAPTLDVIQAIAQVRKKHATDQSRGHKSAELNENDAGGAGAFPVGPRL